MKRKALLLLIPVFCLVISNITFCDTTEYTHTISYTLKKQINSVDPLCRLFVNVTNSTYMAYRNMDHSVVSIGELRKFVTPNVVKPISLILKQLYPDDVNFANSVLMLVHQIQYPANKSDIPSHYPIEYIVDGIGDCEVTYLTASLYLAAGYKTALLYWQNITIDSQIVNHVTAGIALSYTPIVRSGIPLYSVTKNGITYYNAESTGGNKTGEWQVGEISPDLVGYTPTVYTVEQDDSLAGIITAEADTALKETGITITRTIPLLSYYVVEGTLVINQTKLVNQTIVMYLQKMSGYKLVDEKKTDSSGSFSLSYAPMSYLDFDIGTLIVIWNGDLEYKAASAYANLFGLTTFPFMPCWVLIIVMILVVISRL